MAVAAMRFIGYFGFIGMIFVERPLRVMLLEDVFCKCSFSARAVIFIEAIATFELSVSDVQQAPLLVVVEVGPFAGTRHVVFISTLLSSVV